MLADARSEVAKAEQARKTAEAKIKTLEQENADLRKKGSSRPLDFLEKADAGRLWASKRLSQRKRLFSDRVFSGAIQTL